MTETQELFQTLIRGAAVIVYSFLYSLGGRSQKLWRRLAAPILFSIILLFITGIKWECLIFLILIPPLWFGYGGGEYEHRAVYALIHAVAGAFVCAIFGSNGMAVFQFFLTVYSTIYLGVLNPVTATREEFLIGILSVVGIAFTVK